MNGFIKLHRQLIEWEWYQDMKVSRVFLHLLLTANFKDTNWRGQGIKRGQLITSYPSLSTALGLSVQEIRTTFKKLKSTNNINWKPTGKNILVTVVKFDVYQQKESESNTIATGNQHDSNRESTHNQQQRKNDKKEKKDNNVKNNKESVKDTPTQEKIKSDNKELKAEIEKLKNQIQKEKEKSSAKKEKGSTMPIGLSSFEQMEYRRINKSWTQLDINFNGGFKMPKEWDDNLKNEVLGQWIYLDEKKGQNWGTTGTLSAQIKLINEWLKKYTVTEIVESLVDCQQRGNVTPNPKWTINRKLKEQKDEQAKQGDKSSKYTGDATDRFRQAVANGYYDTDDSPKNAAWATEMFENDNEESEQCFD